MTSEPSSAKRNRSGLGSMVRLRLPSSPRPSLSTLARSIRQKSLATSSSRGRKRFTAALIITSLLSSRRSARHSSPFLWREHLETGIKVDLLLVSSVTLKQRNWLWGRCAVAPLKFMQRTYSVSKSVSEQVYVYPLFFTWILNNLHIHWLLWHYPKIDYMEKAPHPK